MSRSGRSNALYEGVLVLAPTSKDATFTRSILDRAVVANASCSNLDELYRALEAGAGAVLLPEEAVVSEQAVRLVEWLTRQPPWSDLPVIILARPGADSAAVAQAMDQFGNVTVLERPMRVTTLVSAVRSALRGRQRQYQIRDHLVERRRVEESLLDANRRKDEFLAMLGHELRNPLGPIRNAIQILNVVSGHEPSARQARQIIDRQSSHMARLIDDLLDIARITHGKLEIKKSRCDLASIVRNATGDYRTQFEAAGLHLSDEVPTQPVWVHADATRLSQIIGNALHNALKFTDPGGYVFVRLQRTEDLCQIEIRDTGIGMDSETLAHMFEAFNQSDRSLDRSRGGLGLGLALIKHLVDLHDGHVDASSDGPGSGSVISIRIPIERAPLADVSAAPAVTTTANRVQRILVIEDNADAAESLCILLELKGHVTEKAHNGPAGLKVARAFQPNVIFCDIGLPSMDGYSVARALRSEPRFEGVSLIALTGYGQEEDQRRTREAGFDLHLVKPIDHAALEMALALCAARGAT